MIESTTFLNEAIEFIQSSRSTPESIQAEKVARLKRLSESFHELKHHISLPLSTIDANDQIDNVLFWAKALLIDKNSDYDIFIKALSPTEIERLRLYLLLDNKACEEKPNIYF